MVDIALLEDFCNLLLLFGELRGLQVEDGEIVLRHRSVTTILGVNLLDANCFVTAEGGVSMLSGLSVLIVGVNAGLDIILAILDEPVEFVAWSLVSWILEVPVHFKINLVPYLNYVKINFLYCNLGLKLGFKN